MKHARKAIRFLSAALLAAPGAMAQPVLLLDTLFTHGAGGETRPEAAFAIPERVPADWKAPVDYSGGTVHFRLEILAKPTETPVQYQPCLDPSATAGSRRACARPETLAVAGLRTWSQPLAQWANPLPWSVRPHSLVLVLKDAYGVPVVPGASDWVGDPYLALYYPMRVRFSAVLAPAGTAFPGWGGLIPASVARRSPHAAGGAVSSRNRSARGASPEIRYRGAGSARAGHRIADIRGRLLRIEPGQPGEGE